MFFCFLNRRKVFPQVLSSERRIFSSVNHIFLTVKGLNETKLSSGICTSLSQHSQKDGSETKTVRQSSLNAIDISSEKAIGKPNYQKIGSFPLKQLTRSAKIFETIAATSRSQHGFYEAIDVFKKRDINRLRVTDFITTALSYMDSFGVSKDVDSYNRLLDLFPKDRYHNKTVFDTLWTRHRLQIDCSVQVLTKLEENRIRPNIQTYDIVDAVFGNNSIPLNKLRRIVFWFDKFDEMYPDPLPLELPDDKEYLHKLAISRIIDESMIAYDVIYMSKDKIKKQIIGAKNKNLKEILKECDLEKPIFLEGPHNVWLRKTIVPVYVLKVDFDQSHSDEDQILALCVMQQQEAEYESKIWLNEIQNDYPKLSDINVIFTINCAENNNTAILAHK